jgi:hypothetical protein
MGRYVVGGPVAVADLFNTNSLQCIRIALSKCSYWARVRLRKLLEIMTSPEGLAVELAVRDWARRDGDVAGRLRRADNRRMEFVRSLFGPFCADEDDVEVRSMTAYCLVIGSYFVAADHGAGCTCSDRNTTARSDLLKLLFPKRAVVLVSGDQPPAAPGDSGDSATRHQQCRSRRYRHAVFSWPGSAVPSGPGSTVVSGS